MKKYLSVVLLLLVALPASASENAGAFKNILSVFELGGSLMWVMLATSVIGLTFALERTFSLRRTAHLPPELSPHILWLLENESLASAQEYLSERNSTMARVLRVLLARCGASREEREKALDDELTRALWDERKNIRAVGLVATVAPLMGLLGTVMGMIEAFRQAAQSGMENPAMFAGGIYQALYTTAFGLIIAIPFIIVYHHLRSRTEQVMRQVEDGSLQFLDDLDNLNFEEADPAQAA